jgi:hypothetical protein
MTGGDGSHFSENDDSWVSFFLICLCLLVGPHPPNGQNPPLKKNFFCVTCFVSFRFCLLA